MIPTLETRIRKVEKLLVRAEELASVALQKRANQQAERIEELRSKARVHATAVAAIVLHGAPKINEPLILAWARTLRHCAIKPKNEYGRTPELYEIAENLDLESMPDSYWVEGDMEFAYKTLYPSILGGIEEAKAFTNLFGDAPIWLLEFARMRWEAEFLGFSLPRMADKQIWGEKGFKDWLRWPELPFGTMSDGDPLPEIDIPPDINVDDEEAYRQNRRLREYVDRSKADYEASIKRRP